MSEQYGEQPEAVNYEAREKNAGKMAENFLLLQPGERVLFLTDEDDRNTDRELIDAIKKNLTARGIEFSELVADDQTGQGEILSAAEKADLIWNSWGMDEIADDVDFDALTEFLEKTGKRMAFCPGVRAESLDDGGALTEDRTAMENRLNKMEARLHEAVGFRITTSYGTDLRVKLRDGAERRWVKDAGVIPRESGTICRAGRFSPSRTKKALTAY